MSGQFFCKWQKQFELSGTMCKPFANFLSIVKTTIFSGLYLGPWCEHSVESNTGAEDKPGQQVTVAKSLRECLFTKSRSMAYGALWKTTPWSQLIFNNQNYQNNQISFSM